LIIHLPVFSASAKRKQASFCFRQLQQARARKEGEKYMSAYIVADKTINNVVNWLQREVFHLPIVSHKLKELGFNTDITGWTGDLGRAMFYLILSGLTPGTAMVKQKSFGSLIITTK
jgi:hypothetical protein